MTEIFQTQRLIIRQWSPEADAAQALEIYGDPDVMCFLSGKPEESEQTQRASLQRVIERYAQLNNGTGAWAIIQKQIGEIVGTILLKTLPDNQGKPTQDYEVGWHLKKAAWGKGYATEAARGAIEYGFNLLKLPVIYAVVKPENYNSIRVTQRLGMIPMGRTHKYYGVELELFKLDAEHK
ncbi:MAG: GNAT family N-acetyltransferase [Brasilonema octagenarum HA4186-MV1]|jgi:RimJ/RimL family protein N-acetyltransferase|nr:GNAT family N-acetyltransferase [Brasilonema octagenarum HA4186-MV1]